MPAHRIPVEIGFKQCSNCKEKKPLVDFWKCSEDTTWGLMSECKKCSRARHVAWELDNIAKSAGRTPPKDKRCYRCQKTHPIECFTKSRRSADGLDVICRPCKAEYIKPYQNGRDIRSQCLWNCYKITVAEFDSLLKAQDDCCAICSVKFSDGNKRTRPVVDHCHDSMRIRGLLCSRCNALLAALDIPGFLDAASDYLERTSGMNLRDISDKDAARIKAKANRKMQREGRIPFPALAT